MKQKTVLSHDSVKKIKTDELIIANKELAFQNEEKEKRAAELIIANKELAFQNEEKEKRAAELIIANKELAFQNEEKEKRAAELIIANKELLFQNEEKEKRAAELIIANKELAFQNEEKEKRAAELIIANKELLFQNEEKEKRAAELIIANEAQRETNEYLENLLNHANAPIIVWNPQYEITRFNKAFESITGRTEKDVLGKSLKILFPPDSREDSMEHIKETLTGERLEVVEINILHINGSVRTLQWNSANIISLDGKTVIATIAQGHDITKRKQAEEALMESLSKFKTLVENIPQKVFVKDLNYKWIFVNKNFALDFHVPPLDIIGKFDSDLFTKELAEKYHTDDVRIFETGQTEEVEEKYLQEGREVWVNTIKTPLKNDDGNVIGLLGIFWEITERKNAEAKIKQWNESLEQRVIERTEQLETANKELEAFSYSISHDLRAPLRHIGGFVDLLIKNNSAQLDETGLSYLNTISSSSYKLGNLIDALLTFSRLSRGEMKRIKISSKSLVTRVLKTFRDEMAGRNIEINMSELPDTIGDEDLINQVWVNLISNALKYSQKKEKAVIDIGSKVENDKTIFFIKDNGAGFDMKYASKLFGVFQRLHKARDFEGIGIGLANVNRIVLRHGGKCWAEGEEGKGAVFFFSLPDN